MKKITYSGTDRDGSPTTGFVEADSSTNALAQLEAQGIHDVELHDDAFTAIGRPDLDGLSERELAGIAEYEIKVREGSGIAAFLLEVARRTWFVIAAGFALVAWGLYANSSMWIIAGAIVAASVFAVSLWNYRAVARYNRLLRCEALGDTDACLRLIEALRPRMTAPEMGFDLAVREACIYARRGALDDALDCVDDWRTSIDDISPGMFESRMAAVYHACGRDDEVVRHTRTAYSKSGQSPTTAVDLALAEARLGDIGAAEQVLADIAEQELPVYGPPFVNWVRGVIALRNHDPVATEYLREAVSGLLRFGDNPAVWTTLGVCTGYYAVALHDVDPAAAEKLLEPVWPVVKIHGDERLFALIEQKMPGKLTR